MQAGLSAQDANMQAALANQQAGLSASQSNAELGLRGGQANQQANLQANQQNQNAISAAGNMGAGMINAGQGKTAYANQQANNWGTAATALQNVAGQYYGNQQQNATNWLNGVNSAVSPASALVSGQTWGGGSTTGQQGKPSTMAKGGIVKRWNS